MHYTDEPFPSRRCGLLGTQCCETWCQPISRFCPSSGTSFLCSSSQEKYHATQDLRQKRMACGLWLQSVDNLQTSITHHMQIRSYMCGSLHGWSHRIFCAQKNPTKNNFQLFRLVPINLSGMLSDHCTSSTNFYWLILHLSAVNLYYIPSLFWHVTHLE